MQNVCQTCSHLYLYILVAVHRNETKQGIGNRKRRGEEQKARTREVSRNRPQYVNHLRKKSVGLSMDNKLDLIMKS